MKKLCDGVADSGEGVPTMVARGRGSFKKVCERFEQLARQLAD
jgi:hypothetical protein